MLQILHDNITQNEGGHKMKEDVNVIITFNLKPLYRQTGLDLVVIGMPPIP